MKYGNVGGVIAQASAFGVLGKVKFSPLLHLETQRGDVGCGKLS